MMVKFLETEYCPKIALYRIGNAPIMIIICTKISTKTPASAILPVDDKADAKNNKKILTVPIASTAFSDFLIFNYHT